jgi:nicotinamide-nucleotide amidase
MTDPSGAILLVIGDELLHGEVVDRNGAKAAGVLAEEGIRVHELRVLPDTIDVITDALTEALSRVGLVLVFGGLGPTTDDLTTEAVTRALGVGTELHEPSWRSIQARFAARGRVPPPGNEKQAHLPVGATLIPNPNGTAPGYLCAPPGALVAVLPGPPRECHPMLTDGLVPLLRARRGAAPRYETRVHRVFGLPESEVGHRIRDVEAAFPDLRVGYQAHFPEILVKLRGDPAAAARFDAATAGLRSALGDHLYAEGETRLPAVLGVALRERGLRIVTAESCTGGLVAAALTDVPGASAYVDRGFVTYSNAAKTEVLGVPPALLAAHGAVSEPVARALVAGALARSGADVGVAITGIAGPDGGTEDKPVGTVWLAWGDRTRVHAALERFPFARDVVRALSVWSVLFRLLRELEPSRGRT